MTTENWKPVVGYEGLYEVSDQGCVRSLTARGKWAAGRILKPFKGSRSGHLHVGLCKDNHLVLRYVHQLVLEAFVGPRPQGADTRHFPDPNPTNNCVENLSWASRSRNMKDKSLHGLRKLTVGDVERIRDMRACGVRGTDAAKWFKINLTSVCDIHAGRSWSHLNAALR